MTTYRSICISLLAAATTACTAVPADPSKMTEGQLREWVKDKSANVSCVRGRTAAGDVVATYVNIDKATLPASGASVTVDPECRVVIGGQK